MSRTTPEILVEAIAASDTTLKYLNCVPWFIEFWRRAKSKHRHVRFVPRVVLVADEIPSHLKELSRFITLYRSELDSRFVAQNIRVPIAGLSTGTFALTTDIDMFPLDPREIDRAIDFLSLKSENFIIVRDVLQENQYPICYNVARPATFKELTGLVDLETISSELETHKEKKDYDGRHGGTGWFSDQERLFEWVEQFESDHAERVIRLNDSTNGHRRLDRVHFGGRLRWFQLSGVLSSRYSDYHVHHPVESYRAYIQSVRMAASVARVAKRLVQRRNKNIEISCM